MFGISSSLESETPFFWSIVCLFTLVSRRVVLKSCLCYLRETIVYNCLWPHFQLQVLWNFYLFIGIVRFSSMQYTCKKPIKYKVCCSCRSGGLFKILYIFFYSFLVLICLSVNQLPCGFGSWHYPFNSFWFGRYAKLIQISLIGIRWRYAIVMVHLLQASRRMR